MASVKKLVYVGNNAALPVVENNTVLPVLPDDLSGSTPELDTGQPGTSFSGTWKVSGGVNSYGSKSLYADANGASYTYNIDLAAPGEYQVFAWWTEYSNRRTSVPYDIIHATGTSTVNVNQQQKGGTWQKLGGTRTFNNQATIRIRSLGNGTTSADAIKLVYVGNNAALPVVENNTVLPVLPDDLSGSTPELDTGQPGTSFSGTWKVSGGVNSYGSKSLYADANGASYTYNIDLAAPGEYQVFAWWTEYSNRRTSVPYDIIHATGTSTVNVNQQQKGGTWQKLGGTRTFNNQATIRIRSLGNGTTSADAIKLVYVGNNTAAQTGSAVLNWTAPVARADGTALALSEIAGYTVYYGTSTGSLPNRLDVDDGSATSATITDLLLGTYYFAVTTRDYNGGESSYSDEVVKIVK